MERATKLQRAQEVQKILHLRRGERLEITNHGIGFRSTVAVVESIRVASAVFAAGTGMGEDGLPQVGGAPIMQEEQALAGAPERCGTKFIRTGVPLIDAIRKARAHVVKSEI